MRVQEETANGGPRPPERRAWRCSGRRGGTREEGRAGSLARKGAVPPVLLPSSGPEAGLAAQVTPEPRASGQRWAREEQPVS